MMKKLAIYLIIFYQKYLSPHKGFCCAYRQYHGGRSCSMFALVVIRRLGVRALWPLLRKRFYACGDAYRALVKEEERPSPQQNKKKKKKTDFCDCDFHSIPCHRADSGCDMLPGCPCDGCELSLSLPFKIVKAICGMNRVSLKRVISAK